MSDITAVVEPIDEITATTVVQQQVSVVAATDSVRSLGYMEDVDLQELTDGSVLVYKNNTSKWTSTTLLNQQILEAGEF